jgi:hypothetical protein
VSAGIATGQLLETRISPQAIDGSMRLFVLLIGLSLYFIEERRYWRAQPPAPVVVEELQRACEENDFGAISRWLGEGLVFSQEDQRLMAGLVLPSRMIVDGDVAVVATPAEMLLFRVKKGQVVELRRFGPPAAAAQEPASSYSTDRR